MLGVARCVTCRRGGWRAVRQCVVGLTGVGRRWLALCATCGSPRGIEAVTRTLDATPAGRHYSSA